MINLPGEFEKQKATVMLFPYRNDIWRKNCTPIRDMLVRLANIIAKYQTVMFGVLPELEQELVNNYELSENIKVIPLRYNDCWARDTVSSVIVGEKKYLASFSFNAYGAGLYYPWDDDNNLDQDIAKIFNYDIKKSALILEGGNIISDGKGTLFAVKEAILNKNRNPGLLETEASRIIMELTGVKKIIWIEKGLIADETGGHIDNLIAFADEKTLLLSYTDDTNNPQYEITHKIEEQLKGITNIDGNKYNIVHVPLPPLYYRTTDDSDTIEKDERSFSRDIGDAVLETYINFALANGVVVVPQFGYKDLDNEAIEAIKKAFPDRTVIPLDAREASLGGGGFHCLTKHIN